MKYLISALLIIISFGLKAQSFTPESHRQFPFIKVDSAAIYTPGDTVGRGSVAGAIKFKSSDHSFYFHNGTSWHPFVTDSLGMIARLNDKVDSVTLASNILYYWKVGVGYGVTLPIGTDSAYVRIGAPDDSTLVFYRFNGDSTVVSVNTVSGGGGSMVYPGAGIAKSNGSAWVTSLTDNSANWNTVLNRVLYTDTAAMLANYQTQIFQRIKISDTSAMLANYRAWISSKLNTADSLTAYVTPTQLNLKVNIADTAAMLSPYTKNLQDVLNNGNIATFNTDNFRSRIQLQNTNSGNNAGTGSIYYNDLNESLQYYVGSSTNLYMPRGVYFKSGGLNGFKFVADGNSGHARFSFTNNGSATGAVPGFFNLWNDSLQHNNLPQASSIGTKKALVWDNTGNGNFYWVSKDSVGRSPLDTTNYMIRLYNAWGINQTGTFPTKTISVDSFNVASRDYTKKVGDSIRTLITTPTLQQVLTAGSTLTTTNSIALGGNDFAIYGAGVTSISGYNTTRIGATGATSRISFVEANQYTSRMRTENTGSSNGSYIDVYKDSISLQPQFGNLYIDSLNHSITATDKMLVWDSSAKKVATRLIPSGGGATPAGNYGNVQLNRFGSLATPASDSLNFSGGLAVKGTLSATALSTAPGVYNVRIDGSGNFSKQDTLTDFTISNASHYLPDSLVVPVSSNALKIKNPKSGLYNNAATTDSSFTFNADTSSSGLSGKYLRIVDTANIKPRIIAGTNVTITGTYPFVNIAASGGSGGGNVYKDVATQNTFISNIDSAYTTTATAAGTTTLTNASKYTQNFTGSTTQTIVLPDATTLVAGHSYYITNPSTGILTVNKNGGTLLSTIAAGQTLSVTVTDISTSAGGWNYEYSGNSLTTANFVFNETPSGTINGTNATFTLANTPTSGTVRIYLNGLRQKLTTQYTLSGGTITMLNIPGTGDDLIVDYLK